MLNKSLLLLLLISIISHPPFIFFHMWTLYKCFLTSLGRPNLFLLVPGLSLYMIFTLSKNALDVPWPHATGPSLDDTFLLMLPLNPQAWTRRFLLSS